MIPCWTDYPFAAAGDAPGQIAPIRRAKALGWDGDKYCTVEVEGVPGRQSVKIGYLYVREGRCGEVPSLNRRIRSQLPVLPSR